MVIMLYQEFNDLLHKLKYSDVNKRRFVLKEIAASIDHATKEDLQELLDFLHTTHDKELQVKLLSILSMYLISDNTNLHIFVSFDPLYETIDSILSKNLPQKTTVVLNFLTLLLQSNYMENAFIKSSLYTHAQNLIRISGCLATMTDIFLRGMVYQDTWRALCRCLAETCNNSEQNQNYCTHLIPKCVKRCSQRNMETFPVLQSLVQNNKRNVKLFLECDGMYLFKRELLQYECSLQLLSAIVQTSAQAAIFAQKQGIMKNVHELLRLCGPYTLTGQWATVILYYADLQMKGYENELEESKKSTNKTQKTATNMFAVTDDGNDTVMLRNAIKEIVQWHAKEQDMYKNIFSPNNNRPNMLEEDNFYVNTKQFDLEVAHFTHETTHKKVPTKVRNSFSVQKPCRVNELSFSFLRNHFNFANKYESNYNTLNEHHETIQDNTRTHTKSEFVTTVTESYLDVNKFYKEHENENTVWDLKEFKPNFVSTPKQRNLSLKSKVNKHTKNITIQSRTRDKVNKITPRILADKKTLKQRSIKARIFDVINNSCTALVNSVTSIFRPKNVPSDLKDFNSNSNVDMHACSYSFTEYMRKRDADVVKDTNIENNVEQNLSTEPESCKTCNNTTVMKHKMLNNIFLKRTVKKLKVGINMYGCDFKKISKMMWPDEDYMTPTILYNLYRKVIMK